MLLLRRPMSTDVPLTGAFIDSADQQHWRTVLEMGARTAGTDWLGRHTTPHSTVPLLLNYIGLHLRYDDTGTDTIARVFQCPVLIHFNEVIHGREKKKERERKWRESKRKKVYGDLHHATRATCHQSFSSSTSISSSSSFSSFILMALSLFLEQLYCVTVGIPFHFHSLVSVCVWVCESIS